MVYVLLGNMTEETYSTLFRIVRHILPLNYNLITFITDYERGLMNAVQQTFPESKLRCCWFHFTQVGDIFYSIYVGLWTYIIILYTYNYVFCVFFSLLFAIVIDV